MISENIQKVKARIALACAKAGRDPGQVTVVAVTKNRSLEEIQQAIEAGIIDIGESRVQEALLKYRKLSAFSSQLSAFSSQRSALKDKLIADGCKLKAVKWHLVGHLQTNKARQAVELFDLIHSVDTEHLAIEIDKQAAKTGKVRGILLEVNTSGEKSKFGLNPDEVIEAALKIRTLKNLKLTGLMTIAPMVSVASDARPYFASLRVLRDKLLDLGIINSDQGLLSMGMSDDFETAVEEGADLVRIGRAIFE